MILRADVVLYDDDDEGWRGRGGRGMGNGHRQGKEFYEAMVLFWLNTKSKSDRTETSYSGIDL